MDKTTWQLKLTAKQLETQSKRAKRGELADINKMKKALQNGEIEKARLYATSATRKKNEGINSLNMSLRLDAAVSKLQNVSVSKDVAKKLNSTGIQMKKALANMDLTKIYTAMENFEHQLENSEVHNRYLNDTLSGMVLKEAPAEQIEELLTTAAEEHGLEIKNLLPRSSAAVLDSASSADDITQRLMRLNEP